MADFAIRFNDFTGGDWGEIDPAKAKTNQYHGRNVHPYSSGLLGVRPGWKLLDLAGKVAGGNPPNYTGICRGFDLMRDHLTLAIDSKSYDIYWDLTLAPGGTLPAVAPATLPGGIAGLAHAQLLYSNDGAGVKEWMLIDGKLCLKSPGATPTWALLSTVGGATAPSPLSVLTRWGLYLIGVDQAVPWRIRFSQVDENGPNFLSWPAANFLDMSTTDPISTVKGIFNLLYLGKASGWFAVSGVLGVLASVRELAIGNGPIDNRAATVTTDNRVVYWPLQKVPAFWNGERVQLVSDQRMDPRTTWLDATPTMARTAPGRGYTAQPWRILMQNQWGAGNGFDFVDTPTLLREIGTTPWTTSAARAADPPSSYGAAQRPTVAGSPPTVGASQVYGARYSFNAAGRITGLRYQRNNLAAAAMTLQAWKDSTQVKAAEVIDNQGFVNGTFTVTFPTPVAVAAGDTWTVGYYCAPNPPIRSDGIAETVTNTANVTFVEFRRSTNNNAYPATATLNSSYVEPIFEAVDPTYKGVFSATHNNPTGTTRPMPPGWSSFRFDSFTSTVPQAWVATDATNTAWRTPIAVSSVLVQGFGIAAADLPTGSVLALFVNDIEVARTNVTKPTVVLSVRAELSFAANDVLSLRFYNPDPVNPVNFTDTVQGGPGIRRPYLSVAPRAAEVAAEQVVCPATGRYDIHVETMGGYNAIGYQLLVNRKPIASCTCGFSQVSTVDDFTLNTMDANDVALTAGDVVGIGFLGNDYNQAWIDRADGPEGTAKPYFRITNRATQQIVGTLGMFGDSVVVTPTERRMMMVGDDGATTKLWLYGAGAWTRHELGVLIAGLAPSDVRMSYLLPEHVVFATKRTYNAEALKVWSVSHDIDRPAFVSDQWASPWDQSMQAGDVLVKGDATLPMWFDGQGRQVRVRSVIVQFVKWNQGVPDGVNQISARVDSVGPYDRGVTPGTEATWVEPMSGAANTNAGTEDSWRFNVGEQGWGNGFQLVFTALYGVAIREAVVLVDVRTERT